MNNKNFFFLSFLPAIAYWYLEENYPIRIAVLGGLGLAVAEISIEYFYTKHVHALSKFNFYLLIFLGSLSLMGDEGIWFKLQPAFSGWAIGGYMGYRHFKGRGLMLEMMDSMSSSSHIPEHLFQSLEKHMMILFLGYSSFMLYVALMRSTDSWLFWKTIGFYIAFGIFSAFEMIYLRFAIKKWKKIEQSRAVLNQMFGSVSNKK